MYNCTCTCISGNEEWGKCWYIHLSIIFPHTAAYITGSIVDNVLLQTPEYVCVLKGRVREGPQGVANFNMLLLLSHSN